MNPRVRFAPSPTGSLHVGNALSAVANRGLGDWMLLRIDDTDAARNVPGGEEEIVRDLGLFAYWECYGPPDGHVVRDGRLVVL